MAPFAPAEDQSVRYRMYCQGFGDCHLLAFRSGERIFRVVIDCGVVLHTSQEKARMQEVVQSLLDDTDGKIDVLVLTHEHYDHLCGFHHAKDIWAKFAIKEVWTAWTEDPSDALAQTLDKYHELGVTVAVAKEGQRGIGTREGDAAMSLLQMLPAYSKATGQAYADIKSAVKAVNGEQKFLHPGDTLSILDGAVSVVALGPPHDEKKIRLLEETGATFPALMGAAAEQTGLKFDDVADYEKRLRALLGLNGPKNQRPPTFAPMYRLELNDCRWSTFNRSHPGAAAIQKHYDDQNSGWRRIDDVGSDGLERLALQLDSFTNNSSLALAFVLKNGNTLLFPADAQVGNWESWSDQKYKIDEKEVSIEDLMKQTKIYKVGHHASHNGTVLPNRFDLMPDDVLCFVPFEPTPQWPKIPNQQLVGALKKRKGLVVSDESQDALPPFVKGPSSDITGRPLFVEVSL